MSANIGCKNPENARKLMQSKRRKGDALKKCNIRLKATANLKTRKDCKIRVRSPIKAKKIKRFRK